MTDEQIALGERAVACKGWRWMPGMLDQTGRRVLCVWPDDLGIKWSHIPESCVVRDADALPDLTDAATIGCLLALVREALNVPTAHVLPSLGAWYIERDAQDGSEDNEWLHVDGVWGCGSAAIIGAKTEAEALVAALEGAP